MENRGLKSGLRWPLVAGMVAPVVFVAVFLVEGWLRPGYSAVAMHVSALSRGERGWVQVVNFLVFGSLLGVFGLGVLARHAAEGKSKAGPILLLVSAVGFFLSGPFVMDPMETPRENMTVHGLVHGILGGIVFVLMPVTVFVFRRSMKGWNGWQGFRLWSLLAGSVIAVALVVFTMATKVPELHAKLLDYQGLLQRAVIVPYMVWIGSFAWRLVRAGDRLG